MIVTHIKNTSNPDTYRVYSQQMKFSEQCMETCERIMDRYYTNHKEDGIIEMQLGTDADIKEGVDAIVYHDYVSDRWQIRNRDNKYAGDIAIKMRKLNNEPDEIYHTTATHYLTVFWNRNKVQSIIIVDMKRLQQHVLSNDEYYQTNCIKKSNYFYPMPKSEWSDFNILHWERKSR